MNCLPWSATSNSVGMHIRPSARGAPWGTVPLVNLGADRGAYAIVDGLVPDQCYDAWETRSGSDHWGTFPLAAVFNPKAILTGDWW
jgi:hypothetical protein